MKSLFEELGGTYTLGKDGMYYPNLMIEEADQRSIMLAFFSISEGIFDAYGKSLYIQQVSAESEQKEKLFTLKSTTFTNKRANPIFQRIGPWRDDVQLVIQIFLEPPAGWERW